jgi:hypothetical protein
MAHFLFLQYKKQKEQLFTALFFARQRPTLAGGGPPTTIGAEELNFRVRNGNGCVLFAIATEPTALNIHLCWLVPRNPSSLSSLVDAGTDLRRRKLFMGNAHSLKTR